MLDWDVPQIKIVFVSWAQCDHMVRLLIQNLAIYSNEHLPNPIKIGQSRLKILPSMKDTLQKCQKIKMLAKVAKFRQIWSHCSWPRRERNNLETKYTQLAHFAHHTEVVVINKF